MICLSVWTGHFIEIMTLFILVIIHELGHVTAAWSYGWRIRSIELLPFGGVATMDEWGNTSIKEEIVVALAGPFHHIGMILISYCFYSWGLWDLTWTQYFIQGNLIIAAFNLLPIYPLDGGRVLQALVSLWMPYRMCIFYTLSWSVVWSVILMITSFLWPGVWVYPPLFIVAIFLLISNLLSLKNQAYQYLRFLLHRLDRGAPSSYPIYQTAVLADDSLSDVIKKWYRGRYHVLQVRDQQGKILGTLTEEMVLQAYFRRSWCMMKELIHQAS